MEKFIPYEKLSKKKKRELDRVRRKTWGSIVPVTRRPEVPGAYDRRKARRWHIDDHDDASSVFFASPAVAARPLP